MTCDLCFVPAGIGTTTIKANSDKLWQLFTKALLCFAFRYEIMMQCWSDDARNRPSFDELYGKLDFMLSTETAMVP